MIRRLIARALWSLSPWTLVTEPGPTRPTVLIGAPHTSNWDFILMLGIAWALDMDIRWMGKDSLFKGWRGTVMRALGGIPVDRANPAGIVDDVVARVKDGQVFGLVVTPDGTRGDHTHWKSGFYRIARATDLPLVLGYVDSATKTTGLGPTIHLTGEVAADMDKVREFYADIRGIHPEDFTPPLLREELTAER